MDLNVVQENDLAAGAVNAEDQARLVMKSDLKWVKGESVGSAKNWRMFSMFSFLLAFKCWVKMSVLVVPGCESGGVDDSLD